MGAAGRSVGSSVRAARALALAGTLLSGTLLAGTMAPGCGGDDDVELLPEELPPPSPAELPPPPAREEIYGADGVLLPSDVLVAGLALPRGSTLVLDEERRHVYQSEAPVARVQQYFGVRLVTGEVDRREGGGATYRSALPRDARGSEVRLDVTIEPSSAAPSRIEIVEIVPPPVDPPSEAEVLERLRARMEEAE